MHDTTTLNYVAGTKKIINTFLEILIGTFQYELLLFPKIIINISLK